MSVRPSDASVTADQIERAEWAALRNAVQPQLPMNTREADWRGKAACGTEDPNLFAASGPNDPDVGKATSVCLTRCPAIKQCRALRYELREAGVWGGVYYPEVGVTLKRCRAEGCGEGVQNSRNPWCGIAHEHAAKVGTEPGYSMHQRLAEPPCAECAEGNYQHRLRYNRPDAKPRGRRSSVLAN